MQDFTERRPRELRENSLRQPKPKKCVFLRFWQNRPLCFRTQWAIFLCNILHISKGSRTVAENAVNPSCDSVTTRQRIFKTFILYILRIIFIKTVVSLSHCLTIRWQKEYWTIAIHRLSTAYPPDRPLLILFYECPFRTFNRAKPFTPSRGGMNLPDYRACKCAGCALA